MHEVHRVQDDAIADHAGFATMQNTGGNQVENILFLAMPDRMSGIVSPLHPDDQIGLLSENIDNFPFSLISPLGSNQNSIRHKQIMLTVKSPEQTSGRKKEIKAIVRKKSTGAWITALPAPRGWSIPQDRVFESQERPNQLFLR